jgi:hypothetical protein
VFVGIVRLPEESRTVVGFGVFLESDMPVVLMGEVLGGAPPADLLEDFDEVLIHLGYYFR